MCTGSKRHSSGWKFRELLPFTGVRDNACVSRVPWPVTVEAPEFDLYFWREKPGKRYNVKKYRIKGGSRSERKTEAVDLCGTGGTEIPNQSIWRKSIPPSPSNGKASIASTAQPSLPPTQAPAAAPPSSATQLKRSLKQADLKLSDIFA